MPRKSKKQQQQTEAPKAYDELVEDGEGGDEDVPNVDAVAAPEVKLRDWRDVEKFKEERRLRKLIDDDLDFEDLGPGRRRR